MFLNCAGPLAWALLDAEVGIAAQTFNRFEHGKAIDLGGVGSETALELAFTEVGKDTGLPRVKHAAEVRGW
jgi:hypothetical protein